MVSISGSKNLSSGISGRSLLSALVRLLFVLAQSSANLALIITNLFR